MSILQPMCLIFLYEQPQCVSGTCSNDDDDDDDDDGILLTANYQRLKATLLHLCVANSKENSLLQQLLCMHAYAYSIGPCMFYRPTYTMLCFILLLLYVNRYSSIHIIIVELCCALPTLLSRAATSAVHVDIRP